MSDSISDEVPLPKTGFFRKLRRIWKPPLPRPSILGLFESRITCEVDTWCTLMNPTQVSECFVDKVLHCKSQAGNQHEFLAFEILSPNRDCAALVVLTDALRVGLPSEINDAVNRSVISRSVSPSMYR